jgi:hypothetical protein
MLILVEGTGENQTQAGQENMGMFQCCYIVLCLEILNQNQPVRWSIAVRDKSIVISPFSKRFLLTASLT